MLYQFKLILLCGALILDEWVVVTKVTDHVCVAHYSNIHGVFSSWVLLQCRGGSGHAPYVGDQKEGCLELALWVLQHLGISPMILSWLDPLIFMAPLHQPIGINWINFCHWFFFNYDLSQQGGNLDLNNLF